MVITSRNMTQNRYSICCGSRQKT